MEIWEAKNTTKMKNSQKGVNSRFDLGEALVNMEMSLISPSLLRDSFAGYRILV